MEIGTGKGRGADLLAYYISVVGRGGFSWALGPAQGMEKMFLEYFVRASFHYCQTLLLLLLRPYLRGVSL